jgi:hypothetical protein
MLEATAFFMIYAVFSAMFISLLGREIGIAERD